MELPIHLLEKTIQRGTILHSTIFEKIDHGKFFVIIGDNGKELIGFFFINSNIYYDFRNKPDILNLHIFLKATDYPFLKYDSFLACNRLQKIDKSHLIQSLSDKKTIIIGTLLSDHIKDILVRVRNSPIFTEKEKKTFFIYP